MPCGVTVELIARCRARHRDAQRRLYELTLPYLGLIAKRYLDEECDRRDALQETYLRLFQHLEQFDVHRASFKTWSSKIALHCCLRQAARSRRGDTQELIVNLHEPSISPTVFAALAHDELVAWLKRMPRPYYEVFCLRVIDGLSHQEIAALLEIDTALSRQRLARGRAWLRKMLPEHFRSGGRSDYPIQIGQLGLLNLLLTSLNQLP